MALSEIPGKVEKGKDRGCACVTLWSSLGISEPEEYGVAPLTPLFFSRTGSSRCSPYRTIIPSKTRGQSSPSPSPWKGILGEENRSGKEGVCEGLRDESSTISFHPLPHSKEMELPNSTSSSRS